jgi:hypothetical protein
MRMSVIGDSYHIGMVRLTIGDHRRSLPFLLHPPHGRRLSRPSPSPTGLTSLAGFRSNAAKATIYRLSLRFSVHRHTNHTLPFDGV